jgi:hypothetical protein
LILFRDVLVGIRDKVGALKKQGRSLEQIVAAKPGARTDAQWGKSFMKPSAFIALVCRGVQKVSSGGVLLVVAMTVGHLVTDQLIRL